MRREKRRAETAARVFRQMEREREKRQRNSSSRGVLHESCPAATDPAIGEMQEGMKRQVAGFNLASGK